jgi:hypothetical protein
MMNNPGFENEEMESTNTMTECTHQQPDKYGFFLFWSFGVHVQEIIVKCESYAS